MQLACNDIVISQYTLPFPFFWDKRKSPWILFLFCEQSWIKKPTEVSCVHLVSLLINRAANGVSVTPKTPLTLISWKLACICNTQHIFKLRKKLLPLLSKITQRFTGILKGRDFESFLCITECSQKGTNNGGSALSDTLICAHKVTSVLKILC